MQITPRHVKDLPVFSQTIEDIFNKIKPENMAIPQEQVYYNWFDRDKLQQALLNTECVEECGVIEAIVKVICSYIDIVNWSESDLHKHDEFPDASTASIQNSKDDNISYVHVYADEDEGVAATALLSDAIDVEDLFSRSKVNPDANIGENEQQSKSIYRYLFKINECIPATIDDIQEETYCRITIGLCTDDFDMTKGDLIGSDDNGNSFAWYTDGMMAFYYRNIFVQRVGNAAHASNFIGLPDDVNSLVLLQIDLHNFNITIACPALADDGFEKKFRCAMPESFVEKIELSKEIRVGMTLSISYAGKATLGVGIVKLNL